MDKNSSSRYGEAGWCAVKEDRDSRYRGLKLLQVGEIKEAECSDRGLALKRRESLC